MTAISGDSAEILNILESRVYTQELLGYYDGKFSPDKAKFFGSTYVRIESIHFEDYRYFLTLSGHSATGADFEKTKKWLDAHSFQAKSLEECVEEGIYTAYAIRFFGAFFEGEWFIQKSLVFFGEFMDEEKAKNFSFREIQYPDAWNSGSFEVGSGSSGDIEMEEFKGMPRLVSHIKVEGKGKVNRAFTAYMNAAVVDPFLRRVRVQFFDEYSEFMSLFGENYTLVFPESKTFFLLVTMARHRAKGYRLVWFFYDVAAGKFFRWTYPQPRFSEWDYHYPEDVIMDLRPISDWDDCLFLNSSRTMDDQRFWSEYVLKKEEGRYLWLEEI